MNKSHLKVSRIMVKRTNLPSRGTTREVGGMISASSRKNTVRESRMEMDRDTWSKQYTSVGRFPPQSAGFLLSRQVSPSVGRFPC